MSLIPPTAPSRCGFVSILGLPNVGKSTLLNALLGCKVSIVSPKPNTTRQGIRGILHLPTVQLIFVDTPGWLLGTQPLRRALRRAAHAAAADADVALVVVAVDSMAPVITPELDGILGLAKRVGRPLVVALNKIDRLEYKEMLLPWMQLLAGQPGVSAVIPISARRHEGLEILVDALAAPMPEGPALFPEDMHTDQAERVLCAELVREQLLYRTQDEVPHSAVVTIDDFLDERGTAAPRCRLVGRIVVARDSQRGIVIGQGGQQLKAIGMVARQRMAELLGCPVDLRLTVVVDSKWTHNHDALRRYGVGGEVSL